MKKSKFLFIGLLSFGLAFASCSSDDDTPPPAGTCATPTNVTLENATAGSVTLNWTSDGSSWTIEYGPSGFIQGAGTQVAADTKPFTINGLISQTDYDFYVRNNCSNSTSGFSTIVSASTPSVLVGTWEAYDVSPLLSGFGITGLSAEFKSNNSFTVTSQAGEAESVLKGNYIISEDANDAGIYKITLNQTDPSTLTSQGIFKVYAASPDSMWYEVAQTDPAQTGVTPPTQAGGFGSTSGGAFGISNIQKYSRQ